MNPSIPQKPGEICMLDNRQQLIDIAMVNQCGRGDAELEIIINNNNSARFRKIKKEGMWTSKKKTKNKIDFPCYC